MKLFNFWKRKKPNVIMILVDGAGREDAISHASFYQQLKKDSLFIKDLISYAPYSIASLNALFSGMYGNINGVNGYYKSYNFDKNNIFTLTQYLKESGYYTELDFVIEDVIPAQGFDKIRTFGKDEAKDIDLVARHSEILTQLKNKQPFFVFLDYNKIALSLVPAVIKKYDDFSEEYFNNKEKNFSNYLEWMEESGNYLKQILEKIKTLGLYENSIIIIFADHGSSVGDRIGEKVYGSYLYDYTIKCWAYFTGGLMPKGMEIRRMLRHVDIMPTILDILKMPLKEGYKPIQGKSFFPFSSSSGFENNMIAYSETGGLGGFTPSPEVHNVQSVRKERWKLIYNKTNSKKELYNLEHDKEEKDNLIGKGLRIEEELWEEIQRINYEHKKINEGFNKPI